MDDLMARADYKAIKNMNREQMTSYMKRVYMRGYGRGALDKVQQLKDEGKLSEDVEVDSTDKANTDSGETTEMVAGS